MSFTKVSIFDVLADLNVTPGKITFPVTTKIEFTLALVQMEKKWLYQTVK